MQSSEFLLSARLDAASLDAWVAAGWLAPRLGGTTPEYSEIDVARAHLIHDLRRMGVNDEGVPVILDLVDQLHGLRCLLRELLSVTDMRTADPVWRRSHVETADPDEGEPGRTQSCPPIQSRIG